MIHLLKNICRVEIIEAYHLQHSDIIAERGVWLNVYQQFSQIDTIGLSSVEISDKIENKQRIFTTKLTMFRKEKLLPGAKVLFPCDYCQWLPVLDRMRRQTLPGYSERREFSVSCQRKIWCNSYCYPDFYHSDAFHIRLRSFYTIYIRYNIAYTNF